MFNSKEDLYLHLVSLRSTGLSYQEIAEATGLSRGSVYDYITGKTMITQDALNKYNLCWSANRSSEEVITPEATVNDEANSEISDEQFEQELDNIDQMRKALVLEAKIGNCSFLVGVILIVSVVAALLLFIS